MKRASSWLTGAFLLAAIACAQGIPADEFEARLDAAVQTAVSEFPTSTPVSTPQVWTQEEFEEAVRLSVLTAVAEIPTSTAAATVTSALVETPTPIPTIITAPTATPSADETAAPTATLTALPTSTATQTAMPTSTPTSTPVLTSVRPENLQELREYMLGLINDARIANGLKPVTLGDNPAPQKHAEEILEEGYVSHWNTEGLKPCMRFALAGGEGYGSENVSGIPYPIEPCNFIACLIDPLRLLDGTMEGLMDSPGHRDNILDEHHRVVHLGIAYNGIADAVVQQFDGDYVQFYDLPAFEDGELFLSGRLLEGLELRSFRVSWEPLPANLTYGQLGATGCYAGGMAVALVRPTLRLGYHYTESTASVEWGGCAEARDINLDTPRASRGTPDPEVDMPQLRNVTVPWITAELWDTTDEFFEVRADLDSILQTYGDGVYTVTVWADSEDDAVLVSTYPIFVGDETFRYP